MKREETEILENHELIYFCDCDNNLVEQVSQTGANDTDSTSGGIFVDDPVVVGRKCLMKKGGDYYIPVFLFNTKEKRADNPNRYRRFVECETASHNDSIYYSYILGHMIEFEYMPNSFQNFQYDGGAIIDYCGMTNQNANGKYPGFSLARKNRNSTIYVVYKNNNTASGFQYHELFKCTLGKWYKIRIYFFDENDNEYNAYITCEDTETSIKSEYSTINFMKGTQNTNNRGRFDFFCDSWGYGSWCQNPIDYIKNVKVYKL